MVFRSINALGLILLAAVASGQAFGRFGFTEKPHCGGISVDRGGFVAEAPAADRFSFYRPSIVWQSDNTTPFSQTLLLSGGDRLPMKVRLNLLSPGPEFFFASGMRLDLASTGAPYLSWSDGSAGPDIPTPDTKWVLISFKNPQPPVLLVFLDKSASVTLTGKPGDWHIVSSQGSFGWTRVLLPFGIEPIATGGAAALGQQTERLKKSLSSWLAPGASLVSFDVKGDDSGVTASWAFDRPGALVPSAALLAPKGGYKLALASKIEVLEGQTGEGPRAALQDKRLTIQFPLKQVPRGRALGTGGDWLDAPATVSFVDVPSVVDLGLTSLLASRDATVKKMAQETLAAYIAGAEYSTEALTSQTLPYRANGQGIDIAAAQALLTQSTFQSTGSSDQNSLLTSIAWRRDWYTWGFDGCQEVPARRAAAIMAFTGALCSEPNRRLDAAMLEAGLAARRALDLQQSDPPARIEPLADLRSAIYGDLAGKSERFVSTLFSPFRILSDAPVRYLASGRDWVLDFNPAYADPFAASILCREQLSFAIGNAKTLSESAKDGIYHLDVTPAKAAEVKIKVVRPAKAPPLPEAVAPPAYSEPALKANPR